MDIEIRHHEVLSPSDPMGTGIMVTAKLPSYARLLDEYSARQIEDRICNLIAEKYVAEHYAEIVSKLDQNAIANLAIADAGKKIAEEIRTRPVVCREKGDTTNNYSIF